jgi:hypothetical protein
MLAVIEWIANGIISDNFSESSGDGTKSSPGSGSGSGSGSNGSGDGSSDKPNSAARFLVTGASVAAAVLVAAAGLF